MLHEVKHNGNVSDSQATLQPGCCYELESICNVPYTSFSAILPNPKNTAVLEKVDSHWQPDTWREKNEKKKLLTEMLKVEKVFFFFF